jgi:methylmalonyl-CoA mutase N-terminal domain/subunit
VPDYSSLEREQASRVQAARDRRDSAATERALESLRDAASTYRSRHRGLGVLGQAHLMPLIIDAVRARATVGEISDTLETEWGRYNA